MIQVATLAYWWTVSNIQLFVYSAIHSTHHRYRHDVLPHVHFCSTHVYCLSCATAKLNEIIWPDSPRVTATAWPCGSNVTNSVLTKQNLDHKYILAYITDIVLAYITDIEHWYGERRRNPSPRVTVQLFMEQIMMSSTNPFLGIHHLRLGGYCKWYKNHIKNVTCYCKVLFTSSLAV